MLPMDKKIDKYFTELSGGDYAKLEVLFIADYDEVRQLYFLLKDYSDKIDCIDYIHSDDDVRVRIYTEYTDEISSILSQQYGDKITIDENEIIVKIK